jgi:hypothetical protein
LWNLYFGKHPQLWPSLGLWLKSNKKKKDGITLAVSWTVAVAEHISCLYLLWVQKHVVELAQTRTEL